MTFLPIVDRELRVASRRNYTYWSRLVAAGFILVIFTAILGFTFMGSGMPWGIGTIEFNVLKWIAFIFACCTGIFLTSDSLSEEKREGTIGLLFLTDLRGYDIVFGKLLSHSLQAFYAFVAAFPVLALPLLLGGVTGADFGRSMLIIGNTIFFSVALGIFVSSMSRQLLTAMNSTLIFTIVFVVILPWIDVGIAGHNLSTFKPILSHASPGYLFSEGTGMWPRDFWFDFALQHFLAWLFLALSCVCIPRAWHEKSAETGGFVRSLLLRIRLGGRNFRLRFRRKLLARNPIEWLASRYRWMPRFLGFAMLCLLGWTAWLYCVHGHADGFWNGWEKIAFYPFSVTFLTLWVASQSCRVFSEAVRTGAMELILVTPLSPRRMVSGQWMSLVRMFLVPVLFVAGVQLLRDIHTVRAMIAVSKAGPASVGFNNVHYMTANLVATFIEIITLFPALAWFGMWMGVTTRKTSIAILKTIVFVVVLPFVLDMLLQGFGMLLIVQFLYKAGTAGPMPFWLNTAFGGGFQIVKNIAFIVVSRYLLVTRFRAAAIRATSPTRAMLRQLANLVSANAAQQTIKIPPILHS
jgi:ABC-type transport system involved in multi-copper enzyme maturation permease subunit